MVAMSNLARVLSLGGLLFWGACQDSAPVEILLTERPLALRQVKWNAKDVPTGNIAAVADLNEDTVVFSDLGAMVFTAGLPLGTDPVAKSWKTATVIPAGDLAGSWLIGIDGSGRIRRLRDRSVMEDVSDRYGLGSDVVEEAVAADPTTRTVFGLAGKLAVADGQKVTRYSLSLHGLAGGSGRVVGLSEGGVTVFTPTTGAVMRFPVDSPVAALFDTAGRLVVATADTLYREDKKALVKLYVSSDAPLRGLQLSSGVVWVQVGDTLAVLDESEVRRAPAAALPADGKLLSSSTGDIWVLSQGTLRRFGEDTGGGAAEDQWKNTVQPVFTRLCSLCHMPGGSANLDLSTYKSWDTRRALMMQRVVDGKPSPMPPKGAGALTQDELTAVRDWLNAPP